MSLCRDLRKRLSPVRRGVEVIWRPKSYRDRVDNEHAKVIMSVLLSASSNCVDVGAHRGGFLALMRKFAPSGRHFAFEPLPEYATDLRRNFPAVEIREAAVAASSGRTTFTYVPAAAGMSGLRRRDYDGKDLSTTEIVVEVVSLDDVLPAGYEPRLIKVDVEGGELAVFKGAERTISVHRPYLLFEHGRGGADYYNTTPADIYSLLVGELGYRIFDLDGEGPYNEQGFHGSAFSRNDRWNWIACP